MFIKKEDSYSILIRKQNCKVRWRSKSTRKLFTKEGCCKTYKRAYEQCTSRMHPATFQPLIQPSTQPQPSHKPYFPYSHLWSILWSILESFWSEEKEKKLLDNFFFFNIQSFSYGSIFYFVFNSRLE